jgi:nicotinamide-nucleotide amidase
VRAELLAVGTELLLGDIVNTNAAWLGQQLTAAGVDVLASTTVGDNVERIVAAVRGAAGRADAVVMCGGLGPTQDDLTREALARVADVPLRRDDALAAALAARYDQLGRRMPERNLQQADLPEGAEAIPNPVGTAPGVRLELGPELGGAVVYALPGVPHELEEMVRASVLPDLLRRAGGPSVIVSRVLRTAGTWESAVAEALADLDRDLAAAGNPTLAYLAGEGQVRVRITAKAASREEALAAIRPVEERARSALGAAVYGVDDDTLDGVVHRELRRRAATVAVAESLTGGLLGTMLTTAPGASETFLGSLVVYATPAKVALAGVPEPLVEAEGAVSPQVAAALAAGARSRFGASFGLGVTGVAGPDPQDGVPPGTVHIGLAGPDEGTVRSLRLPGDRLRVRLYAATAALDLLRRRLTGG